MQVNNLLDQNGYLHVKNVIDKKLCNYLTSALLLNSSINNINNNSIKNEDVQVPNTLTFLGQSLLFDTLLENIWPVLENNINEELLPTYSYARLYKNGNILTKHKDRPSCEISVTIQLGRSHHYAWPIFIEGKRFDTVIHFKKPFEANFDSYLITDSINENETVVVLGMHDTMSFPFTIISFIVNDFLGNRNKIQSNMDSSLKNLKEVLENK